MEKMKPLTYKRKLEFKKDTENELSFVLQGLERGFGNTLGVALRRVLLSSITNLAPFCVRIEGAEHEFTTLKDVIEDVPSIIMNLRKVRFSYNPEYIADDEIIKAKLLSSDTGKVTAAGFEISNPGVKIIDTSVEIAETLKPNALKIEMYLRGGRGFMSFEENKTFINSTDILTKLQTEITNSKTQFIAVDSEFSPIKNVNYKVKELNTASAKIEEELEFNIETDGTVSGKNAIKEATKYLIGLFQVIGEIDNIEDVNIFEEPVKEEVHYVEDDLDIAQLNLSVRSSNALRMSNIRKLSKICELTKEELEGVKNLGKKSVEEIIAKIKEHGKNLKGEE
ncbi:DNA-directed RNA polymerase subunit alpha [Mycoplasma leonicaptivi]|uniref:DNA-directed RNA polymerase subunit alpha n=1 Tax=Mycoplasma leonicaptivi TaxID=36742 RepID=UPI0004808A39|nr:DNA-directed RNA polymerase subunit alpha [Mycoplasma leonicaptivi]